MDTIIFFDLENTLIWDWTDNRDPMWLKHPEITEWIFAQGDFRAGLFSWAIWNPKDIAEFSEEGGVREAIETTHQFQFEDDLIITRGMLGDRFRKWFKTMPWVSDDDWFEFFKKRQTIQELWLHEFNQPNTRVVLLDDTVENVTMINNSVENNRLELIDPWTFKGMFK